MIEATDRGGLFTITATSEETAARAVLDATNYSKSTNTNGSATYHVTREVFYAAQAAAGKPGERASKLDATGIKKGIILRHDPAINGGVGALRGER